MTDRPCRLAAMPLSIRVLAVDLLVRIAIRVLMLVAWVERRWPSKLPFPADVDELSRRRDWLFATLQAAGQAPADATLIDVDVVPIKRGEAFRSEIARVTVRWRPNHDSPMADQPSRLTLLAKFAPRAGDLRDHAVFIAQQNHIKEVGAYQRVGGTDVAMPACWYAEVAPEKGKLLVLMQDMQRCRAITETEGCPPELCDQAIDAMATLHARYWQRPDGTEAFATPIPDALIDWFASLLTGDDEVFGDVLRIVWRRDKAAPTTLLHGDARVGNMLFARPDDPTSRFVFIDWQAARPGKGIFDVAYFLVLSVDPDVRRAHVDRLLRRYHNALIARGVDDYPLDALLLDYQFAVLMVLSFVTLPFLSAESSATDANAAGLQELGRVWAQRMAAVVDELDVEWIASWSGIAAERLAEGFRKSNARAAQALGHAPS